MCIVLRVYRGTISVGSALAFNCFQALSWIGSEEIQLSLEETFLSEILDISLALVALNIKIALWISFAKYTWKSNLLIDTRGL